MIKGRPCVHSDDDLIVSHIAIAVSDMAELRKRLEKLNVTSRKNLSVPNPADSDTGIVEQVCTYITYDSYVIFFLGRTQKIHHKWFS